MSSRPKSTHHSYDQHPMSVRDKIQEVPREITLPKNDILQDLKDEFDKPIFSDLSLELRRYEERRRKAITNNNITRDAMNYTESNCTTIHPTNRCDPLLSYSRRDITQCHSNYILPPLIPRPWSVQLLLNSSTAQGRDIKNEDSDIERSDYISDRHNDKRMRYRESDMDDNCYGNYYNRRDDNIKSRYQNKSGYSNEDYETDFYSSSVDEHIEVTDQCSYDKPIIQKGLHKFLDSTSDHIMNDNINRAHARLNLQQDRLMSLRLQEPGRKIEIRQQTDPIIKGNNDLEGLSEDGSSERSDFLDSDAYTSRGPVITSQIPYQPGASISISVRNNTTNTDCNRQDSYNKKDDKIGRTYEMPNIPNLWMDMLTSSQSQDPRALDAYNSRFGGNTL
eukprot:Tbor_TRINITY_DN1957_c0_g1::TRINITY_DN1957_c0_g1_i1::g.3518::m.3518